MQKKLEASQGKDVTTRKELTGIADELIKKEDLRTKALAKQAELQKEINRMKDSGIDKPSVYQPLETARK